MNHHKTSHNYRQSTKYVSAIEPKWPLWCTITYTSKLVNYSNSFYL